MKKSGRKCRNPIRRREEKRAQSKELDHLTSTHIVVAFPLNGKVVAPLLSLLARRATLLVVHYIPSSINATSYGSFGRAGGAVFICINPISTFVTSRGTITYTFVFTSSFPNFQLLIGMP